MKDNICRAAGQAHALFKKNYASFESTPYCILAMFCRGRSGGALRAFIAALQTKGHFKKPLGVEEEDWFEPLSFLRPVDMHYQQVVHGKVDELEEVF